MKIMEVVQKELDVEKEDDQNIYLKDPQTGIKTVVPKDPKKPGALSTNDRGEMEVDLDVDHGQVEQHKRLHRGDKVKVKQHDSNSNTGQHRQHSRPTTAPGANSHNTGAIG